MDLFINAPALPLFSCCVAITSNPAEKEAPVSHLSVQTNKDFLGNKTSLEKLIYHVYVFVIFKGNEYKANICFVSIIKYLDMCYFFPFSS